MPFIKPTCPQCGKVISVKHSFNIAGKRVHLLECSHVIADETLSTKDASSITSLDGKKPYNFQVEGIKFSEEAGGRVLIADEMGLGKTIQACGLLRLHLEMQPFVVVCRSTLLTQWQREIARWCSDSLEKVVMSQIIQTAKDYFIPGMKGYIISFDLLRRFNGSLNEKFRELGIKTLIIDECQHIKNPDSDRTRATRELSRDCEYIVALSGTPIKNNASEYFSILNILEPKLFHNYSSFQFNWCESYWTGYGYKTGGLKDPTRFKEKTKHFIIRRERKEVLPDLPSVSRQNQFTDLTGRNEDDYKKAFKEFRDEYFSAKASAFEEASNTMALMSKLRHITGRAKVLPCSEFVYDFLVETDRKLTVFVHHKDVAEQLLALIKETCSELKIPAPLSLTASLSMEERSRVVDAFMHGEERILIASTLASGEGLNLQKCSDCVMLERQWNPANEEQAEARFIRIGQLADKVTATYFIACGTIDEYFTEIVERKREIVRRTLGSEAVKWDQTSIMKELAETLIALGGRKWGL